MTYGKEELINKLRYCGNAVSCLRCPYWAGCGGSKEDLMQAADAIEELSRDVDITNAANTALYGALPKWIPVTEKLPQEWWPVLGLIQFHDEKEPPAQEVLWYLGNGHWRETWRGDMIESPVTHWMPLPEAPKDGE